MNLSTFNSKLKTIPLGRSFIITLSLLGGYHFLVLTKLVPPSNGINQWQTNVIKMQRYAYQKSKKPNLVLVGSSLTANINSSDIGSHVVNLGMKGGCAQTGIEAVQRNYIKPLILLVEINGTIKQKIDDSMINSIYNPFLYYLRLYFPMLREEYQPLSVFVPKFILLKQKIQYKLINAIKPINFTHKNRRVDELNLSIKEKLLAQFIERQNKPLTEKQKNELIQESNLIKSQILRLKKDGVRIILYDIPVDPRLNNTIQEKQRKVLMQEIFSIKDFEWLPAPPPKNWKTYDGIHIVPSDAKDFATFIENQLFDKNLYP